MALEGAPAAPAAAATAAASSATATPAAAPLPRVVARFREFADKDPEVSLAVSAVQVLTEVIRTSHATTIMGLQVELREATEALVAHESTFALASTCEIFTRFVTRTSLEHTDFDSCKAILIDRGEHFLLVSAAARTKIAAIARPFIRDGAVILTHGFSRSVLAVLLNAASRENKRFSVVATESRPDGQGVAMATRLERAGIPVTLVADAAVAHCMERVDVVFVGAEAVVENGGIINRIGTFQIALVARALKRPLYVAAESFKFTRMFPLTQKDVPVKPSAVPLADGAKLPPGIAVANNSLDYTPPHCITMLFTDLGCLTPSAVSDELIKLFL